jgi:hypothetical protein
MSTPDFSTAENNQELAQEVSCLKAMITLMLQAMGQADAGRVIIKMEKQSRRWKMRLRLPYSPAPLSKLNRHIVSNQLPAEGITNSRSYVWHAEQHMRSD